MASFVPHMHCSFYEQCELSFVPIGHPSVALVSAKPLLHPSFSHLVHIVIPNTHNLPSKKVPYPTCSGEFELYWG